MHGSWRTACAAVLVASGLACGMAVAEDADRVGAVLAVRGAVFKDSAGSMLPLAAQAPVRERDAIVATDGKAKIALDDGTMRRHIELERAKELA